MEGWFYDAICADMGVDAANRVRYLYDSRATINDLPMDIVVHILSMVDKKDVLNVMCVCKQWLKATQQDGFWKVLQRAKVLQLLQKMEEMKRISLTPTFKREVFAYMDMSAFQNYGVRERYCFIFAKVLDFSYGNINWAGAFGIEMIIMVELNATHVIEFVLDLERGLWSAISTEKLKSSLKKDGLKVGRFLGGTKHGTLYLKQSVFENGVFVKNFDNVIIDDAKGVRFEGSLFNDTNEPHGAGKWTFADGSTLTGDNVAFNGVPHGKGVEGEQDYYAGEPLLKRLKANPFT